MIAASINVITGSVMEFEVENQANQPLDENSLALAQIQTIEQSITPRRIREAVLGIDNGWLAEKNAEIEALRLLLK